MNAFLLANAIESSFKHKNLVDAFEAIVAAYYEEYTDADELDGEFYSALQTIFYVCFPHGETDDGREFEDFTKKLPRT